MNFYETNSKGEPLKWSDVSNSGYDGFIGFGEENGECCEDCICADDCGEDITYLCEICPNLDKNPQNFKSYVYSGGDPECYECSRRWKMPSLYSAPTMQFRTMYAFRVEAYKWRQTNTTPAYLTKIFRDNKTNEIFYSDELEEDGVTERVPVVCGVSMANYEGASFNPFTGATGDYEHSGMLEAYGFNCTRGFTRWHGENMYSWQHGHSSAGGWDHGGYGWYTTLYAGDPSRVDCPCPDTNPYSPNYKG